MKLLTHLGGYSQAEYPVVENPDTVGEAHGRGEVDPYAVHQGGTVPS